MKKIGKILTDYPFFIISIAFIIALMVALIATDNLNSAVALLPLLIVLIAWFVYAIDNDEVWILLEQAADYLEHFSNKYEKLVNNYNSLVDDYNRLNPDNPIEKVEK